jgi:hypothetical protein
MKNLFCKSFNTADAPVLLFAGGTRETALMNLLAEETVSAGRRILIVSAGPEKYPIEGKVLISPDTGMIMELIKTEEIKIIYLAGKIENDILMPLSDENLAQLAADKNDDIKIFYKIDNSRKIPEVFYGADLICLVNFNILKEKILDIYSKDTFKSSSTALKKICSHVISLIEEDCPCINNPDHTGRKYIFIAQVKTLLDENLLIPVARQLKSRTKHRVFYGSVNHYQVKEV